MVLPHVNQGIAFIAKIIKSSCIIWQAETYTHILSIQLIAHTSETTFSMQSLNAVVAIFRPRQATITPHTQNTNTRTPDLQPESGPEQAPGVEQGLRHSIILRLEHICRR